MTNPFSVLAVVALITATISMGLYGLRFSRTTSDFFVASRSVRPFANATAISGEYLSAASFMGIAGLIMVYGIDMLWYPVGYTVGYLVLLVLIAAPLRRSGAYTLPDFAEARLESRVVRRISSLLVVSIGWLYLLPQMQAAGLTLQLMTGAPVASGGIVVAIVVGMTVMAGGMRSITLVQSFQYWLKLIAIAVPTVLIAWAWTRAGSPRLGTGTWGEPLSGFAGRDNPFYSNISLVVATFLGTMGLPHVLVRFYTIRNGRAARRTTLNVLVLLSAFYVFPPILGALGRHYAPDLLSNGNADSVVLVLPQRVFGGLGGQLLGALVSAGAFAAFLSTASGLVLSIAGVISQDLLAKRLGGITGFRTGTAIAVVIPLVLTLGLHTRSLAEMVAMAFAVAASTFCPLLVLGIWWRDLSTAGAVAGLVVGGLSSLGAVLVALFLPTAGLMHTLLVQPAAWTVPLAFLTMIVVSRLTPKLIPPNAATTLGRLHTPDKFVG